MDNIEATDKVLSISSQCGLLGISRSQYYYQPSLGRQEKDFKLLVEIKKVQAEHPYYGYRRIWREMDRRGHHTSETTVRRVMRRSGIAAIFPGRNLSKASKHHYLGLGHVGNHCHNGCDLKDDIDKDNNKWNGNAREKSTCVMFGSANGKESFCSECAMQVRKVDLSEGVY